MSKEAMKQALRELRDIMRHRAYTQGVPDAITALETALAAPAQPVAECIDDICSESSGWLRAIDEALVCSHLDVANADDTYEVAKAKLNKLLCYEQDIGAYFAVPSGWRMVPVAWTREMRHAFIDAAMNTVTGRETAGWEAALAIAPEAPTAHAPQPLTELAWIRQFFFKDESDGVIIAGAQGKEIREWIDRVDVILKKEPK